MSRERRYATSTRDVWLFFGQPPGLPVSTRPPNGDQMQTSRPRHHAEAIDFRPLLSRYDQRIPFTLERTVCRPTKVVLCLHWNTEHGLLEPVVKAGHTHKPVCTPYLTTSTDLHWSPKPSEPSRSMTPTKASYSETPLVLLCCSSAIAPRQAQTLTLAQSPTDLPRKA
jgi:hypothetical protein